MKWMVIILLLLPLVSGIRINEVMYNPLGGDDGNEFVEILGTNLTNYSIGDLNSDDNLTLVKNGSNNYSLIVEENFDYSGLNATIYSVGSNIGNGLSNSGDSIFLYFNNTLVDNMSYSGGSEGYSLEYRDGEFQQSILLGGTPGVENSKAENVTQNVSNTCNISLDLEIEKVIYDNGETISFVNKISNESSEYSIEYWVEDLFGNIVKTPRNTSNKNEKKFTPNINEPDKAFVIKNKLSFVDCNNTEENIENFEIVGVKGSQDSCSEEVVCEEHISKVKSLKSKVSKQNVVVSSGGGGGGGGTHFINRTKKENIASFYTRKKNFEDKIKLFTRIEARGIYTLRFNSQLEEFNFTIVSNNSETEEFIAKAEKGRNLYLLELIDYKGKIVDIEKLIIEFKEEIKNITEVKVLKKQPDPNKTISTLESSTGSVVYQEETNFRPDLITTSLLLSIGGIATLKNLKNKFL